MPFNLTLLLKEAMPKTENRNAALGALLLGESVSTVARKYGAKGGGGTVKAHHALLLFGMSAMALTAILRVKGKDLRADNSPIGLGVKGLLIIVCATLVWYPFELFMAGPTRLNKALNM